MYLAGHAPRRLSLPPIEPSAEPQFRWTFKTWIKERKKGGEGYRWDTKTQDSFTMTVLASSEAQAKAKIVAALPPIPADTEESYYPAVTREAHYTREWDLEGAVEEVER